MFVGLFILNYSNASTEKYLNLYLPEQFLQVNSFLETFIFQPLTEPPPPVLPAKHAEVVHGAVVGAPAAVHGHGPAAVPGQAVLIFTSLMVRSNWYYAKLCRDGETLFVREAWPPVSCKVWSHS